MAGFAAISLLTLSKDRLMTDIGARYEFRIWANTLEAVRIRLQGLATLANIGASKETYLISSATDRCNTKIRNDFVDIKVLVAEDRGLEQWQPALKIGFPLNSSVIATQIFPRLELEAPRLSAQQYCMDRFLDEIVSARSDIAIVVASKVRHQFILGACQAEFSSVTINDAAFETVAVESRNPGAVLTLIRQLDLVHTANTSYVRQIKRVLANSDVPRRNQSTRQ
jgi:hypothetical protein